MGEAARRKKLGLYPTRGSRPPYLPPNPARNLRPATPTVPLSEHVKAFARTLSEYEPVVLPFTNVDDRYVFGACHLNVTHRAREAGGERVFGWMIWTCAEFTEGEFHAVWRSPEGELVDVTPRAGFEAYIVFVRDEMSGVAPQGSGALVPSNRTTLPSRPYSVGNRAAEPLEYLEPDIATQRLMTKLGMPHCLGA